MRLAPIRMVAKIKINDSGKSAPILLSTTDVDFLLLNCQQGSWGSVHHCSDHGHAGRQSYPHGRVLHNHYTLIGRIWIRALATS